MGCIAKDRQPGRLACSLGWQSPTRQEQRHEVGGRRRIMVNEPVHHSNYSHGIRGRTIRRKKRWPSILDAIYGHAPSAEWFRTSIWPVTAAVIKAARYSESALIPKATLLIRS